VNGGFVGSNGTCGRAPGFGQKLLCPNVVPRPHVGQEASSRNDAGQGRQKQLRQGHETAQRADGTSWLVRENPHRPRSMASRLHVSYMDNCRGGMLFTAFDRADRQID